MQPVRRVQRIDLARIAAGEDAPADHRGLRECLARAGEPESPLQFQLRNLVRAQARHGRRLHAAIRWSPRPSRSNTAPANGLSKAGAGVGAERLAVRAHRRRKVLPRDKHRHRSRLRRGQGLALLGHLAGGQRRQHALRESIGSASSSCGARPTPLSWHCAQCFWYTAPRHRFAPRPPRQPLVQVLKLGMQKQTPQKILHGRRREFSARKIVPYDARLFQVRFSREKLQIKPLGRFIGVLEYALARAPAARPRRAPTGRDRAPRRK